MSTTIDLDSASTPTNNTAPINPVQQSHDMSTLEEPVHVTIVSITFHLVLIFVG